MSNKEQTHEGLTFQEGQENLENISNLLEEDMSTVYFEKNHPEIKNPPVIKIKDLHLASLAYMGCEHLIGEHFDITSDIALDLMENTLTFLWLNDCNRFTISNILCLPMDYVIERTNEIDEEIDEEDE